MINIGFKVVYDNIDRMGVPRNGLYTINVYLNWENDDRLLWDLGVYSNHVETLPNGTMGKRRE